MGLCEPLNPGDEKGAAAGLMGTDHSVQRQVRDEKLKFSIKAAAKVHWWEGLGDWRCPSLLRF